MTERERERGREKEKTSNYFKTCVHAFKKSTKVITNWTHSRNLYHSYTKFTSILRHKSLISSFIFRRKNILIKICHFEGEKKKKSKG